MGSMKHQGASFYENMMINTNVVEASRRAGARKVTAMGTGAVYPFPSPGLPLKEDMIFLGRPHPPTPVMRTPSVRCWQCLKTMKKSTA